MAKKALLAALLLVTLQGRGVDLSVSRPERGGFSPESAAHKYVTTLLKKQVAHAELAALKDAIAMAMSEYNPAVAAHLAMLPEGTPEAKEGAQLYAKYMQQIDSERLRKIDLEERKRLEALEIQKLQMQYEYEATVKQMEAEAQKAKYSQKSGAGGKLRSFFNGASVWSMASQVLSRCLFLF